MTEQGYDHPEDAPRVGPSSILRLSGGQPDEDLIADLARNGLVVETIHRTAMHAGRLIVVTHDRHGLPLVAIVSRGPGEHNEAFARLMTKGYGHSGD